MCSVETGQMFAVETGQMAAAENGQTSTIATGRRPVLTLYMGWPRTLFTEHEQMFSPNMGLN